MVVVVVVVVVMAFCLLCKTACPIPRVAKNLIKHAHKHNHAESQKCDKIEQQQKYAWIRLE